MTDLKHTVSREVLYHCRCCRCEQWWTIADLHASGRFSTRRGERMVHCPACGFVAALIADAEQCDE